MRPAIAQCFVAVVVLGCGGATCLYSGAGPVEGGGPAMRGTWGAGLAFFADLLTVPIPTAGIADVRDIVLLVCTGAALVLAGMTRSGSTVRSGVTRWMATCASAVIVLAVVSALAWRSFDLSWGWIVRFAAGAGLAIVISQRFTAAMVRQAVAGLLVVGAAALILTIWHRANRGYAHFSWPIGPITIVGGLAAVWAALAGVFGVGYAIGRGGNKIWAVVALAICALSIYALLQTERRSPAMGLVAGVVIVAAIAVWRRNSTKAIRGIVCVAVVATVVGGAAYVVRQARSPDREKSGPIAVREAYWEHSTKFVGQHPLVGIGPDRFVIEMTLAIAPLRAEMPHVYHGNIDPAAHNEWLQAVVELGLPAGLAYAALPIGVLFLALRRPESNGAIRYALAAALVALFVCEAASINLRGPILAVWYWTLLGLLAATARLMAGCVDIVPGMPSPSRLRPLLLLGGGLALLVISFAEILSTADDKYRGPPAILSVSRISSEKTLASYYAEAFKATNIAIGSPSAQQFSWACGYWQRLFDLLPVYRDTATRYADCLVRADKIGEARAVLESVIAGGLSPYDFSANALYSMLLPDDPVGQLRCLQRALRSGSLDNLPSEAVSDCRKSAAIQEIIRKELPEARRATISDDPSQLRGSTIELLRLNAYLLSFASFADAVVDQRLAAECYRRLECENNTYRRAHNAESDAFYVLATFIQYGSSGDFQSGFDAIVNAERYAVLGINHENVAHPNPKLGFVGGEVVPTEFPERLRPLWRLSAWYHLFAGHWDNLGLRILASLPPESWTPEALARERALIAESVCDKLEALPVGRRPPHYDRVCEMAKEAAKARGGEPIDFEKGRTP